MELPALKRTAILAILCSLTTFLLYSNLRQATEPPTANTKNRQTTKKPAGPPKPSLGDMRWTLDEAMDAYAQDRTNAYVQYVMLQLALKDNRKRLPEVLDRFSQPASSPHDLFAGQHAVQRRLQWDVMVKEPDRGTEQPAARVPLTALPQPTRMTRSGHSMLAGKTSKVSELSRCVPADNYVVEFRSLMKLLDMLDAGQDWVHYFFTQGCRDATDQRTQRRILTQLLLDDSPGQRQLYSY